MQTRKKNLYKLEKICVTTVLKLCHALFNLFSFPKLNIVKGNILRLQWKKSIKLILELGTVWIKLFLRQQ